ncbi:MAG: TetR/AcrR family transcriptional regulator [bacterium]|nr:TetR/AcrR family transcriptional regulator [bacterium]
MTGLRERKKLEVRRRILGAAAELFGTAGLEATTIDAIAERAEVSVGTVYNYFGSKNALLLAEVETDTDVMIEAGRAVLRRPGADPAAALKRLIGVYFDAFVSFEPGLLREVMAASFRRSDGADLTAELTHMDERLLEQIVLLVTGLQEKGQLRNDVEPSEAALLIFSIMVTHLLVLVAFGETDAATLKKQVNRQIDLSLDGLRKPEDRRP